MKPIPITKHALPIIIGKLEDACGQEKTYECVIRQYDDALKARQRKLCYTWYREAANESGWYDDAPDDSHMAAYCKYHFGLRIMCEGDKIKGDIVRRMLEKFNDEDRATAEVMKIAVIKRYPDFFPVLRDNDGLNSEQTGRYLTAIQAHFALFNIELRSNREKELLNCKEANK